MDFWTALAAILGLVLAVLLAVALVKPEKFQ